MMWSLLYLKFKPKEKRHGERLGVMRIDGRAYHGGMTDRFNGIISFWNYCQANGLTFKLWYVYPFNLTQYLVPNNYDWEIEEKDIPDGILDTYIFYGRGEKGRRLGRFKTRKNVWYYGNIDVSKKLNYLPYNQDWGTVFRTLFKPSPLLQNSLDECKRELGSDYKAVVYRFQQLLGDFKEGHYRTIKNDITRHALIQMCLDELDLIYEANSGTRILVTSDSCMFLTEAAKKKYVYTIPGRVQHMDFSGSDNEHAQLKSFLDFFMIAGAKKVYSVVIGNMYSSQFPEYAAKLNNVPFERIILNELSVS